MTASELPSGTVTFLFTDLEDSTRLLERLGSKRYGQVLSRHNAHLRTVFERHGGIEVDSRGDRFFAVFRSAGSAVAAAGEAQRMLAGEEGPEALPVRVRIGLHTGEASIGEGVYVGIAIHVAASVGAAAEGGQILLTSTVASIVEHDLPAGERLRDLGDLLLKGLERPERVYLLELDDLPAAAFPEPPDGVEAREPPPLLEREADLAALRLLIGGARDGNGRLALIEGSAGIGKTSLLAETRAFAAETGLRVLSARGGELEREFAFGLVRQLFEPILATAPSAQRAELFAGAAGLAAPLFGESSLAEGPANDVSFAILHGLYWLAANTAASQPTLLLVDDLHWGDPQSLRWLAYLGRRLDGLPLMVVVGTRPPEHSEQPALLTELLTDSGAVVLRPGTLGRDSVAILTRSVFAAEPEPEFCAACQEATGGNPLYLRALLITLAGDGVAPAATSAARVREVGPEPVARAVSIRLSHLPGEADALARAIAVLGSNAELGRAAELAGLEPSVAVAAAASLARAELIREDTVLEFTHPVVRAAVYGEIGALDRAAAHRRAAALLTGTRAEPEQAAGHLLLVPPDGDAEAVQILRDAARRALGRGAPDAAAGYLSRALAEPPTARERVAVLVELGLVERAVDIDAAVEHLRGALDLADDPLLHGEVALACGRALLWTDRSGEAIDVFRRGVERLGAARSDLREQLEAELLHAAWWEPEHFDRRLIPSVREEDLGGGFGTDVLLAALAFYETRIGTDRQRAIDLAKRSLASGSLARETTFSLYYAAWVLGVAGQVDAAMSVWDGAIADARRRGDLVGLGLLLAFRGALATEQGRLPDAEQDVREGLELCQQVGGRLSSLYCACHLADFLLERGQLAEAEALLAGTGLGEQVPESAHSVFFLDARGRLLLAQGRPEHALADFLALGRIAEALDMHNPGYRPWRSHAAAALHALGRREEALRLARAELELSRGWGAPRTLGISLRALGLLEGGSEGEQRLREAVDVLATSPAQLEHAQALVELGAALRRRNERSEARELLRRGVELAHRCGGTRLVEHGNEELAATGVRPRKVLLTGLESLTASERRVAKLAAEELSNKEIAQALFVTVKTVEVHLSNVYRKLDIGSRRQLGAALARPTVEPVAAGA